MTRLARRASVFIVFYVFTSAATAHAECAWALWNDTTHFGLRDEPSFSLNLLGAAPTYQQCEQIRIATAKSLLRVKPVGGPNVDRAKVEENGNIVTETTYLKDGRVLIMSQRFSCLPDTMDPRGPKGK
jgi:hypothetical protein